MNICIQIFVWTGVYIFLGEISRNDTFILESLPRFECVCMCVHVRVRESDRERVREIETFTLQPRLTLNT
jgi:hypothetical protein